MGNCLKHFRVKNDAFFDPENDIKIERKPDPVQMTQIDYESEIELGERTSMENMNCTNIDEVILEPKEQKDIDNMNIKMMSEDNDVGM